LTSGITCKMRELHLSAASVPREEENDDDDDSDDDDDDDDSDDDDDGDDVHEYCSYFIATISYFLR